VARRSLGANVAASSANVVIVVGVSLVTVPLLVNRLGLGGYGLWALAQSLVVYVTSLELGFGPALARATSMRIARRGELPEVLVTAVLLYLAVGVVLVIACHLLAEPLVGLFSVPASLHDQAVTTVGLIGWVTLAALLAGAFDHMLIGLERFRVSTTTNVIGSLTFLTTAFVGTSRDALLQRVALAALLQWSVVAALRLLMLSDVMTTRGRRRPGRALVRELVDFSARLQAAVVSTLLNTQTDRLVVGVLTNPTTLGQVSIATQIGDAARFLGFAAFNPLASRMATTYARDGREALDELLRRYRPMWIATVLGVAAIAIGAARPGIELWLGHGQDEAALFAAILFAGYGIGMLPSPQFAHRRATGAPGIEGLFGVVTVAVNVVASVALGLLFGAIGVVSATAVAYALGTAWALRRLRCAGDPAPRRALAPPRTIALLPLAALATYAIGEGLVASLPRFVALAGLGAAAPAVLAVYVAAALGPGALRDAVGRASAAAPAADTGPRASSSVGSLQRP
jgi:O-antigen/teichoic acid export membrane protein